MKASEPGLFIALDGLTENETETLAIAEKLAAEPGNFGFKFNLDYALDKGWKGAVETLSRFERTLFADLKTWNGSRTMAAIVGRAVDLGVKYVNVYALADKEIRAAAKVASGSRTSLLGLTVLSHYDDDYCRRHFGRSFNEEVRYSAEVAVNNGCQAIILPGTSLDAVTDISTSKVVTGIRPVWYKDSRHEQETEPRIAIAKGGRILVCGSPIMKSPDPVAALRRFLKEFK